uniref:Transposase n=1 Tax=Mesocestoides corti TaxID=53468 RepID=A0A5K3ERK5_MESCO
LLVDVALWLRKLGSNREALFTFDNFDSCVGTKTNVRKMLTTKMAVGFVFKSCASVYGCQATRTQSVSGRSWPCSPIIWC